MHRSPYLALSLVFLALCAAPLRAEDTPEQFGAEVVNRLSETCSFFTDQIDYVKCPESEVYFSADALLLRRQLTNINFPTTSLGVGGPILAQLQDLKFDTEAGLQLTAGYRFNAWCSIEGQYFGQQEWRDEVPVTDPQGRLFGVLNKFGTVQQPIFPSPPFPPTFGTGNNTTFQSGGYSSRINNYEVNLIGELIAFDLGGGRDRGAKFSVAAIGGLRYIHLAENFFVRTSGDVIPAAGINDPGAFANYNIDASNDFFGGQIGGRFRLAFERLELSFDAKFAVLADGARQRSQVTFLFNQPVVIPGLIQGNASDLKDTELGQLSLTGTYELTSHLRIRAGYTVMYLNGRALAPDQIDTGVAQTNTLSPILNTRGTTMFYGSFFGGELKF